MSETLFVCVYVFGAYEQSADTAAALHAFMEAGCFIQAIKIPSQQTIPNKEKVVLTRLGFVCVCVYAFL